MSQVIKSFMGLFLILFLMSACIGILSAFMIVVEAQDMHAQLVDEMENSNFNSMVIKQCFEKANECGYSLSVTCYHDAKAVVYTNINDLPDELPKVSLAKLELSFPFSIPFFGIHNEHTLCAYAR